MAATIAHAVSEWIDSHSVSRCLRSEVLSSFWCWILLIWEEIGDFVKGDAPNSRRFKVEEVDSKKERKCVSLLLWLPVESQSEESGGTPEC